MPAQLLECLIRHIDHMRTAAIDKSGDLPAFLQHEKPLRVVRDPLGNLGKRRRLIPLIGRLLDGKAAVGVGSAGSAKDVHGPT